MNEAEIRALIRSLLDAGLLPRETAAEGVFAGYGNGEYCDACKKAIDGHQVAVEVEHADGVQRQYHGRCYDLLLELSGGSDQGPGK